MALRRLSKVFTPRVLGKFQDIFLPCRLQLDNRDLGTSLVRNNLGHSVGLDTWAPMIVSYSTVWGGSSALFRRGSSTDLVTHEPTSSEYFKNLPALLMVENPAGNEFVRYFFPYCFRIRGQGPDWVELSLTNREYQILGSHGSLPAGLPYEFPIYRWHGITADKLLEIFSSVGQAGYMWTSASFDSAKAYAGRLRVLAQQDIEVELISLPDFMW
jgi:hypothetical protein